MHKYKIVQHNLQTPRKMERKLEQMDEKGWELVCFGDGLSFWRKEETKE